MISCCSISRASRNRQTIWAGWRDRATLRRARSTNFNQHGNRVVFHGKAAFAALVRWQLITAHAILAGALAGQELGGRPTKIQSIEKAGSGEFASLIGGAAARAAAFGFAVSAMLALPSQAVGQDFDLTMGVLASPNSLYTAMMEQVPERISRATDGKVQVMLNDSLVGGTQITAAVRDGRVPMSGALHTYLAGDDPRMGLFNLPGLVNNMAEYIYLCEAFWCEDVERLWEENWNSIVLAEGAWCSQALFSKEPIRTLEDFRGKVLRVHNPKRPH
jgi:hypothetical protein